MVAHWANAPLKNVVLDAAGLLAIAELPTLGTRTALKGSAFYADAFVLCPGIHRQQDATALNGGEYPVTANMSSGYVFRVENQATVSYLQSVGRTGHLTTLLVTKEKSRLDALRPFIDICESPLSAILYLVPALLTCAALALMAVMQDYWGLAILLALMLARLLNVFVVRRRCDANWHGVKEPGVTGDLLILLSQDRWIRMKGYTDHLKAVTSGQWLRDTNFFESTLEACGTIIVYLSAALGSNFSQAGKITFILLLLLSTGFLSLSNEFLRSLRMKDCLISVEGVPKSYERRLHMAEQLIEESGRRDWALRMGMINTQKESTKQEDAHPEEPPQDGVLV